MSEDKPRPDRVSSRLRGMASDPRNVRDMHTLVAAANAVDEHAEMLALLRELCPPYTGGSRDITDVTRRVHALLARIDKKTP